ncbi:uncharacterized protein MONBRDRAFT_4877 [Monosiga brevicollis MX1]|uniref:Uncharacterized protein n=1 Tax=Monosiga brevicollis TaxID=81824 RepID=A9UP74_MONBE|nr:uncharacterized protein MONBRDRAFT_4877 [Monosiga brevicollis MX1]EDQ92371.1 predicted protein [Monosiga brevicollis MX1]|eukprot:XP_001742133.1 hypothetical protein [Monosiga brevicollis MX1]
MATNVCRWRTLNLDTCDEETFVRLAQEQGTLMFDPLGPFLLTALHVAARRGFLSAIRALLSVDYTQLPAYDVGFLVFEDRGRICPDLWQLPRIFTPFHSAVEHGQAQAAELLRAAGANINQVTPQRRSALHLAVIGRNMPLLNALLRYMDAGLINAVDADSLAPLDYADNIEQVFLLIQRGARLDTNGLTLKHLLFGQASMSALAAIILAGCNLGLRATEKHDQEEQTSSLLSYIIRKDHVSALAQELARHKFAWATSNRHAFLKALVADENFGERHLLQCAQVDNLLPPVFSDGSTLLHHLAGNPNMNRSCCEILEEMAGCAVNARNADGHTMLDILQAKGRTLLVEELQTSRNAMTGAEIAAAEQKERQ